MKLNLNELNDGLEGNWWNHIRSSDFGFISEMSNLKEYEVQLDDILIHKQIEKEGGYPIIRYHVIIKGGSAIYSKKTEITDVLIKNLAKFIKEKNKFPNACTYSKMFKNGNIQVNYAPSQYDKFALKFDPKQYGLSTTENYYKNLKTIDNPIKSKPAEPSSGKKWEIKSSSDPSKKYTVSRDKNGNWSCSCPQFSFRKIECKHIQQCKKDTS